MESGDIRAAVARWARERGWLATLHAHGPVGHWLLDDRPRWEQATGDRRGDVRLWPPGAEEWHDVDPAASLLWACVIECEAEPLDVGRCRVCHGLRMGSPVVRGPFEEHGRLVFDVRQPNCPACNGTGRETVEAAHTVLDAAPGQLLAAVDRRDSFDDAVAISEQLAVARERLHVLADRLQASTDPAHVPVGEWAALWLAGSVDWIEPAAAWLFDRQIERTRVQFMTDHATVYGADVVWQMLALALRHKPDYIGPRWHVDRRPTIAAELEGVVGVGVDCVCSPDELLHVDARLIAEIGDRMCTVTIRGRASLDGEFFGVPASELAGAPIMVHVATFGRCPELRAALGLEQRAAPLGPGGVSFSAAERLRAVAPVGPVFPVPLYSGDFDPVYREIVVSLDQQTVGSDLLTATSAARTVLRDQHVTFRIEHLRAPRPDGAIALAVRR